MRGVPIREIDDDGDGGGVANMIKDAAFSKIWKGGGGRGGQRAGKDQRQPKAKQQSSQTDLIGKSDAM